MYPLMFIYLFISRKFVVYISIYIKNKSFVSPYCCYELYNVQFLSCVFVIGIHVLFEFKNINEVRKEILFIIAHDNCFYFLVSSTMLFIDFHRTNTDFEAT